MSVRVDLAYDFAVRALEEQRATIDSIRNRAALIFGFASIVNLELARLSLAGVDNPAALLAVLGGVSTVVGVVYLLSTVWQQIIKMYPEPMPFVERGGIYDSMDESRIQANVVAALDEQRVKNEAMLKSLGVRLHIGIGALVVSAMFWLLAIASRG